MHFSKILVALSTVASVTAFPTTDSSAVTCPAGFNTPKCCEDVITSKADLGIIGGLLSLLGIKLGDIVGVTCSLNIASCSNKVVCCTGNQKKNFNSPQLGLVNVNLDLQCNNIL